MQKNNESNNDKEILINYSHDGKDYNIKILDKIPICVEGKRGIYTNRVLLAKKQTENDWTLIFIQLVNTNCDKYELICSTNTIIVSDENNNIKRIISEPNDKILTKICGKFTELDNRDLFHYNTKDYVDDVEVVYYYREWYAQKETHDIMQNCTKQKENKHREDNNIRMIHQTRIYPH